VQRGEFSEKTTVAQVAVWSFQVHKNIAKGVNGQVHSVEIVPGMGPL